MPAPVPAIGRPPKPTAPPALDPALIIKLDRYGYLDARYAEAKHWLDERETLRKAIQEQYKDAPPDQPIHAEGTLYTVTLGMRENQQRVTDKISAFKALRNKIGITALMEAITITLKLLDEHLPKEQQASFVATERTGPRPIRSAIKSAPQAA